VDPEVDPALRVLLLGLREGAVAAREQGRTLPWLSRVTPSNASDTKVKATSSRPKKRRSTWNSAPPQAEGHVQLAAA